MWKTLCDSCDDIRNHTEETIKKRKYPFETHTVVTEDGYINSMYRIPHGKTRLSNNNDPRCPVILLHGMSCSCAVFVDQGVLAYYLADEGYDVWLPNNRGTTFSRKHKQFDADKDKEEYWSFSWHEIGIYDTSAFIDYTLQVTGLEKLHLIGHSQGATAIAVLLSERPEYNDKIALCCLLGAPIIFENEYSLRLTFISKFVIPALEVINKYLRVPIYEMPFIPLVRLAGKLTIPNTFLRKIYMAFFFLIAGNPDPDQISEFDFRKLCLTTPNSFSVLQSYHFVQIIKNTRFAQYDHGPKKNMKVYGCEKPPLYNLSNIKTPIALFNSKNDMFCNPKDVEKLEKMLGNVVHKHLVESELFNHADFIFARDSIELLYNHVVKTSQNLEDRLKAHKYSRTQSTALNKHKTDMNHNFNYNQTKILEIEKDQKNREILEMLHIRKNLKNTVNNKTDIQHLSTIYTDLIFLSSKPNQNVPLVHITNDNTNYQTTNTLTQPTTSSNSNDNNASTEILNQNIPNTMNHPSKNHTSFITCSSSNLIDRKQILP